ncbi:M1-specific T cell receptor beta chain-like [Pteropus medius]|nr:M1-specific T cell receptor beta chain-like [Pteropus giganteus]
MSWAPDATTMGSRLLCCVALCLLGAGPVDSGVTQTPRHLVKAEGQTASLRCSPVSGHLYVYWYQQAPGQGPQFLLQYFDGKETRKENLPDRFSVKQLNDSRSELNMSSLELADSAVYLCASSKATAWHSHLLPAHKPHTSLPLPPLEPLTGPFIALRSPTKGGSGHQWCFGSKETSKSPLNYYCCEWTLFYPCPMGSFLPEMIQTVFACELRVATFAPVTWCPQRWFGEQVSL